MAECMAEWFAVHPRAIADSIALKFQRVTSIVYELQKYQVYKMQKNMFTLTLWTIKGREEGKDCDLEMTEENNSSSRTK